MEQEKTPPSHTLQKKKQNEQKTKKQKMLTYIDCIIEGKGKGKEKKKSTHLVISVALYMKANGKKCLLSEMYPVAGMKENNNTYALNSISDRTPFPTVASFIQNFYIFKNRRKHTHTHTHTRSRQLQKQLQ
jgi:hypothetical protein